jgi:DNA polymerase-4
MAILDEFSPVVEVASVDEAYMDMTGTERLFGPPLEAAERIRQRIRMEALVTASIGIGSNRLVAKVATERAKPDGVRLVPAGQEATFMSPLPVRSLPGIGPRAAEALQQLGIRTLGELAAAPVGPLRRSLGLTSAEWLKRRAAGQDETPVAHRHEAKSISAETTFDHDISDRARLAGVVRDLSERVGNRLRHAGKRAANVHLKLRYSDFTTITRQQTLSRPADGDEAIGRVGVELLRKALRERLDPVRLVGIGVGNLREREGQLSLLDELQGDDSAVSSAMDAIRERFGAAAVRRGGSADG